MHPMGSPSKNQPEEPSFDPELRGLTADIKRAFPGGEPDPTFRIALRARLVTEAERLYARAGVAERRSLLRRAVVGAAAVSVASVAVVLWRSGLLSPRQLLAAHGAR